MSNIYLKNTNEIFGQKTVLIVYRGGWCPYCNAQLADMQEIEKEFTGFPTIHRKEPIHSPSGLVRKANESIKRNEKK